MLYEAQEAVIKLIMIVLTSEAKYKTIHGQGHPLDLAMFLKILTAKNASKITSSPCTCKRR